MHTLPFIAEKPNDDVEGGSRDLYLLARAPRRAPRPLRTSQRRMQHVQCNVVTGTSRPLEYGAVLTEMPG